jgi:hypothetical protein
MSIKELLCSTSVAAALGACSSVPGPVSSMPYYVYQRPAYYTYQRPAYVPTQHYAAPSYRQSPVASAPSPSWNHDLGNVALGAGVGAVGGMIANKALSGETAAVVGEGAEAAEVGEAVTAGRALGAARAGAAALGAAEAVEGAEAAGGLVSILSRFWWVLLE